MDDNASPSTTDELLDEIRALRARVEAVEGERKTTRATAPSGPVSRRHLLKIGAFSAGLLAADAARPRRASADNGDPLVCGSTVNSATAATGLLVTHAETDTGYGLGVVDTALDSFPISGALAGHTQGTYFVGVLGYGEPGPGTIAIGGSTGVCGLADTGDGVNGQAASGRGVYGRSDSGSGVHGDSQSGIGVSAQAFGAANGLFARSEGATAAHVETPSAAGAALEAKIANASNHRSAVEAQTNGVGAAVQGLTTGSGPAVRGTTTGAGAGVIGNAKTGAGVQGTSPNGIGVLGTSANGRGAVLYGKAAHLRLYPAPTSSHPSAGARGDLYVDSSGRLWYCKTGGNPGTWKQIA
jgi:hypothetical protein